jgi:hypothetical protein
MADNSGNNDTGASLTDILTGLQQGVIAISNLAQEMKTVTTISSGQITIHLTQVSS